MKIELSCDCAESAEFCAFLETRGHSATVGNSTGNYVDGVSTSGSSEANDALRALWDAYC